MSIIDKNGFFQPVTVLRVKPNFISQLKTPKKDGYSALQLVTSGRKAVAKAQRKHQEKSGLKEAGSVARELRLKESELENYKLGQKLGVELFSVGQKVNVSGLSKGKGFAGTIKRHNFASQPKSHGGKSHRRRPGAIGSTFPQKVVKGKKMAGQMGYKRVTIKGLRVLLVDEKRQLLAIKGAVPGPRRSLVVVLKV